MKRTLLAVSLLALGAGSVGAQSPDPIAARKALMKRNGMMQGELVRESRGERPFDLAKVKEALTDFVDAANKMPALYPDNSKTGGDTHAQPAIWDNKADFAARFVKLRTDAEAAMASITDLDSLKAQGPKVFSNCGGCHEIYRTSMN